MGFKLKGYITNILNHERKVKVNSINIYRMDNHHSPPAIVHKKVDMALEIYKCMGLVISAQQYFQLYHEVNFIGGRNWNTQKKTSQQQGRQTNILMQ